MRNSVEAGHSGRDWYLAEWLAEKNKRQADIVRDLGWERSRASKILSGKQPYTRDDLRHLADWLGIDIHELFIPPREAEALRRLRETAIAIAAEAGAVFDHEGAPRARGERK